MKEIIYNDVMPNALINKGIILSSGQISKGKIDLMNGAVILPFILSFAF
jgi:hypothetical protein